MDVHGRLFSEGVPDLPHARQLRDGFAWLRFGPQLESEYLKDRFEDILPPVRVGLCLVMLIVGLFTFEQAAIVGPVLSSIPNRLGLFVKEPLLVLTLAATFAAGRDRFYQPIAAGAATICGICQVIILGLAMNAGIGIFFPSMMPMILFAYLMAGLAFYYALAANALIFFAYLALPYVTAVPAPQYRYGMVAVIAANLIGGMTLYLQERTARLRFLEAALLSEMVLRDGLTGIHNRRMFDQHLQLAWNMAVRDGKSLALLLVDIDFFKAYNDRYGHQEGDDCLRLVAGALQQCGRRPMDFVARYGGEEFSIVLYDPDADYVSDVLTRVQHMIADLNIQHEDSPHGGRLTVSIGAGHIEPTAQRSSIGLIQLADEALYSAKDQGRNRIVVMRSEYAKLTTGRFDKRRRRAETMSLR
jgi:diguanylate cyclase (GGDEF)-like protein